MSEEKIKILEMIKDGVISSEEGLKLLEAVENKNDEIMMKEDGEKWIKIRITDDDNTKVNVNLPFKFVKIGMKIGKKYIPDNEKLNDIDFDEIIEMVEGGAIGKIVEIQEGNEKVDIYVE